jgi:hypothetical protein
MCSGIISILTFDINCVFCRMQNEGVADG